MINVEKKIAGKTLNIQTGKIARQSAGSVVLTYGDTTLLVAVNAAKEPREDIGFFPLQVEYREKHYASGKIPGGFFKREARPTEGEVLTSRLTDRPIRPLFPKGFKNETHPKIEIIKEDSNDYLFYKVNNIIGIVSDQKIDTLLPQFKRKDIDKIAEHILNKSQQ